MGFRPGLPINGTVVPQKRTRSTTTATETAAYHGRSYKVQGEVRTPHLLVARTAGAYSLVEGMMDGVLDCCIAICIPRLYSHTEYCIARLYSYQ